MGHDSYVAIDLPVGLRTDLRKNEMKKIKKLLEKLSETAHELSLQATEADEFVVVKDIEIAVHEAQKVFKRTKEME